MLYVMKQQHRILRSIRFILIWEIYVRHKNRMIVCLLVKIFFCFFPYQFLLNSCRLNELFWFRFKRLATMSNKTVQIYCLPVSKWIRSFWQAPFRCKKYESYSNLSDSTSSTACLRHSFDKERYFSKDQRSLAKSSLFDYSPSAFFYRMKLTSRSPLKSWFHFTSFAWK